MYTRYETSEARPTDTPAVWEYRLIENLEDDYRRVHRIRIEVDSGPLVMEYGQLRQGGGYIPFLWYVDTVHQKRAPNKTWQAEQEPCAYHLSRDLKDAILDTAPGVWWTVIWGRGQDTRRCIDHFSNRETRMAERARLVREERGAARPVGARALSRVGEGYHSVAQLLRSYAAAAAVRDLAAFPAPLRCWPAG